MWTTGIMTLFEPEKTPFVIQIFHTLNFKSLQNLNAKKLPNTSTYRDVNIFL